MGTDRQDYVVYNEVKKTHTFLMELSSGAEESKPIQILRYGEWDHPHYGKIKFDKKYMETVCKNFDAEVIGGEIPFNFDHNGGPAPGWVKGLVHKGSKLYAIPEWTPLGLEAIQQGLYKYISCELRDNHLNCETGEEYGPTLSGVALTNYPFVKNMEPISLSEVILDNEKSLAKITNLEDKTKEVTSMSEDVKTVDLQEEIKQQLGELSSKLALEESKRIAAENLLAEQTKRTDLMEKQLKEKGRDEVIRQALSEGKITPAIRDNWASEYALKDPEGFLKFMAAMPQIVNFEEKGKAEEAKGLSATELYSTEVNAVMAAQKLSYKDAMIFVNKAKPELFKSYKEEV